MQFAAMQLKRFRCTMTWFWVQRCISRCENIENVIFGEDPDLVKAMVWRVAHVLRKKSTSSDWQQATRFSRCTIYDDIDFSGGLLCIRRKKKEKTGRWFKERGCSLGAWRRRRPVAMVTWLIGQFPSHGPPLHPHCRIYTQTNEFEGKKQT